MSDGWIKLGDLAEEALTAYGARLDESRRDGVWDLIWGPAPPEARTVHDTRSPAQRQAWPYGAHDRVALGELDTAHMSAFTHALAAVQMRFGEWHA